MPYSKAHLGKHDGPLSKHPYTNGGAASSSKFYGSNENSTAAYGVPSGAGQGDIMRSQVQFTHNEVDLIDGMASSDHY